MTPPGVLLVGAGPRPLDDVRAALPAGLPVATCTPETADEALHPPDGAGHSAAVVVLDLAVAGAGVVTALRAAAPDASLLAAARPTDLADPAAAELAASCFAVLQRPPQAPAVLAAVRSALAHHELLVARRSMLDHTLPGLVEAFVESLALANPLAYRRTSRTVALVNEVAARTGVVPGWRLRLAALLSQLGCFAVPAAVLDKIEQTIRLPFAERRLYDGHLRLAADLLAGVPELAEVAEWVREQVTSLDQLQPGAAGPVPGEQACLSVASAFLVGYDEGLGWREIHSHLTSSGRYPADLVDAVLDAADVLAPKGTPQPLPLAALAVGMVLAKDVRTLDGALLVRRGEPVTFVLAERLRAFASLVGVGEPLWAFGPEGSTSGRRMTSPSPGRTPGRRLAGGTAAHHG